jgi:hypothetical protein
MCIELFRMNLLIDAIHFQYDAPTESDRASKKPHALTGKPGEMPAARLEPV